MNPQRQAVLDALDELRAQIEHMDDPAMTPPGDQVPMQPVVKSPTGTLRFRENALVRHLLDFAHSRGCGLNELARLPNVPQEDWAQLAQLIGYSLGGYSDLSYALGVDEAYAAAEAKGLYQPPRES